MKNLIRRVLKEEVNDKMINLLKKRFDLSQYDEIIEFLYQLGYNETEIKDIYGEFFESETNLEFNPLNWMRYNYNIDNLETVINPDEPNIIYYKKNGKIVMEQDSETKHFWFDYFDIWTIFDEIFDINNSEKIGILNIWLEETLNLTGYRLRSLSW
jgi:hypothetical protein